MKRLYLWLIGQAVKTPPSHGGIRGSIPLSAAKTLADARVFCLLLYMQVYSMAVYVLPMISVGG